MTVQEMITELAASLGNRTDLTNARYLTWLNWSLLDVCGTFKRGAISPLRFHTLEEKAFFTTIVVSGTITAATSNTAQLEVGDVQADDYYNDWVIEITGYDEEGAGVDTPGGLLYQKRVIYDYDQGSNEVTLCSEWDTTPDAYTSYSLYKRTYSIETDVGINPIESLFSIQRIEKQSDGESINHTGWRDVVGKDITSTGYPESFSHRGNYLVLDPTPDTAIRYRVYYYRYPVAFSESNLSAECELPLDWHEIVLLGAVWRGFEKLMEPERAKEASNQYLKSMMRQESAVFEDEEIVRGMTIRRE